MRKPRPESVRAPRFFRTQSHLPRTTLASPRTWAELANRFTMTSGDGMAHATLDSAQRATTASKERPTASSSDRISQDPGSTVRIDVSMGGSQTANEQTLGAESGVFASVGRPEGGSLTS